MVDGEASAELTPFMHRSDDYGDIHLHQQPGPYSGLSFCKAGSVFAEILPIVPR